MRALLLLLVMTMGSTVSADAAVPGSATAPTAAATAAPSPTPAAPACRAAEYRQFDFWLGEWDVFGKAGQPVGRSRIEAVLGGCALAEHWSSGSGAGNDGTSLNLYNAQTGHWEQFWVDAQGGRLSLSGGRVGAAMQLSGQQSKADPATGIAQRERITWTPLPDGSVRQLWESSKDEGKTWTVAFDGLYRRARK